MPWQAPSLLSNVYNNPLLYTDPTGNRPYAEKQDNGKYNIYFSSKIYEYAKNTLSARIPFVGSWVADKATEFSGLESFSNADIKAAELILDFSYTESAGMEAFSAFSESYGKTNLKYSNLVKYGGKIVAAISLASTAESFLDTYRYNDKIDRVIEYYLNGWSGNFLVSETKAELLAKYLYASERIEALLNEGIILFEGDSFEDENYVRAFKGNGLDQLKEELSEIGNRSR